MIKKNIANFLSLLNLTLGFAGIIAVMFSDVYVRGGFLEAKSFYVKHPSLVTAAILVFIAAFIDFFDGFVARKTNSVSELGKQFDSFADMVSFGILPALIAHNLILRSNHNWSYFLFDVPLLSYLPVLLVLASVIRLAKYNTTPQSNSYFKGLATPANAMFWASLPLVIKFDLLTVNYQTFYWDKVISNPWILAFFIVLFSYLLISEIPTFSLKRKSYAWTHAKEIYLLVALSAISFVFLKFAAIPICILLYLALSLILKRNFKNQ